MKADNRGSFHIRTFVALIAAFVVFQFLAYKFKDRIGGMKDRVMNLTNKPGSKGGKRVEKVYYPNGKLQAEVTYNKDVAEGITKTYYESGNLFSVENYVKGKQEGAARSYHETGELLYEKVYKNGKMLHLKEFDKEGNVVYESK